MDSYEEKHALVSLHLTGYGGWTPRERLAAIDDLIYYTADIHSPEGMAVLAGKEYWRAQFVAAGDAADVAALQPVIDQCFFAGMTAVEGLAPYESVGRIWMAAIYRAREKWAELAPAGLSFDEALDARARALGYGGIAEAAEAQQVDSVERWAARPRG